MTSWNFGSELRAPAYPNSSAFYLRFFTHISGFRDQDGHPLHEVDFRDEYENSDYTICKFHGRRNGLLINQKALNHVLSSWKDAIEEIKSIKGGFLKAGLYSSSINKWNLSMVPMFLPLYYNLRYSSPGANTTIPNGIASLFKVFLDVTTTIDLMIIANATSNKLSLNDIHIGTSEVHLFAEKNSLLINGGWACAGSPAFIEKTLGLLFDDTDEQSETADSLYDINLFRFTSVMTVQYVGGMVYLIATMILMERLYRRIPNRTAIEMAEADGTLSAYETRRRYVMKTLPNCAACQSIFNVFLELASNSIVIKDYDEIMAKLAKLIEAANNALSQSDDIDVGSAVQVYDLLEFRLRHLAEDCQKSALKIAGASIQSFPDGFDFLHFSDTPRKRLETLLQQ